MIEGPGVGSYSNKYYLYSIAVLGITLWANIFLMMYIFLLLCFAWFKNSQCQGRVLLYIVNICDDETNEQEGAI